jgi:hypothetical protein
MLCNVLRIETLGLHMLSDYVSALLHEKDLSKSFNVAQVQNLDFKWSGRDQGCISGVTYGRSILGKCQVELLGFPSTKHSWCPNCTTCDKCETESSDTRHMQLKFNVRE